MSNRDQRRSGRRHFLLDNAVVFVANILTRLRGLLVLPMIVGTLGSAAYGTWTQSLTFAALASAVLGLSFHLALVRLAAAPDADRGAIFSTLLAASFVILATAGAALSVFSPSALTRALIGTADGLLFALSLAMMVVTGLRNLVLSLMRATGRLLERSAIDLVSSLIDLVAIVVALRSDRSLTGALIASLAVNVLTTIVATTMAFRIARPGGLSLPLLKEALLYGLPLVPATAAIWVLDRGDRFVISHYLDQAAVGVYSAQYTIGGLLVMVLSPIQTTLVPKVAQLWDSNREGAARYVTYCFRFFFALSAFFVFVSPVLGPPLLALLGSSTLAVGAKLNVTAIAMGVAFWGLGVIVQMPLFGSKKTGAIGTATAVGAALNFAMNVVLVPRLGLLAAAGSTLVTYGVMFLLFWRATRREIALDLRWRQNLRAVLAGAGGAAPVALLGPDTPAGIVACSLLAFGVFVALVFATGGIDKSERQAVVDAVKRLRRRE